MSIDPLTVATGLLPGELERPDQPPARSERVAEIVEAARRVLEDEGPAALTMRRLAEELHMQAPSLYKHFSGKADVELALIADGLFDMGDVTHAAIRTAGPGRSLWALLEVYRLYSRAHPNLYRLSTGQHIDRDGLPQGLEEWAGNPFYVVTGDPATAQALWSFAHGTLILELDHRFLEGSDIDRTWRAGTEAFTVARST